MTTLQIIKHHGNVNEGFKVTVRLYDAGETRRDVTIDLFNELKKKGGYGFSIGVLNSGSEKFKAPQGFELIDVWAKTQQLNEKGNLVCRTINIMAAYKP
jgi:hypothetical protein